MMTEKSSWLLVAVFVEEKAAGRALDALKKAEKSEKADVQASATVVRDGSGQLHIREAGDPGSRRGALVGGLIGAVIGLLGGLGGAIVAGAVGALVGGFTARVIDSGIPNHSLRLIGQSLMHGYSAVVLIVDENGRQQVEAFMAAAGARVFSGDLVSVIAQQLQLPPNQDAEAGQEPF